LREKSGVVQQELVDFTGREMHKHSEEVAICELQFAIAVDYFTGLVKYCVSIANRKLQIANSPYHFLFQGSSPSNSGNAARCERMAEYTISGELPARRNIAPPRMGLAAKRMEGLPCVLSRLFFSSGDAFTCSMIQLAIPASMGPISSTVAKQ